MRIFRRILPLAVGLVAAAGIALAATTALSPPIFSWGQAGQQQIAGPVQIIGYDSSTSLPCIVGSTSTCQLATSASVSVGSVTANQGTAAATSGAWPVTLAAGGALVSATNALPIQPGTGANLSQETGGNLAQTTTDLGPPGATACATDTGSCSLNALLQRLAQRLTTINTTLNAPFQAGGSIGNTAFGITGAAASAALSDALANPTTLSFGSYSLGWDATNTVWRRLQVDAASGTLKVDPGSVAAGQNGIGNVGGKTVTVCNTLTVTTGNAYGANYVVGGLQTFANAFTSTGSGILQAVTVTMKDQETSGFVFVPFNSNPSSTTWTDAAVAAINAADVSKVRGPVALANNTQLASTLFSVQFAYGLGLPLAPGSTSLFGVLLASATLTNNFAGASDVQVCATMLDDE